MKIASCVVLYNPNEEIFANIQTYLPLVETLYVMDNSTKEIPFLQKIKEISKVKYISLNGNKGIAQALKSAADAAIADGFDFLLTMDQDSKFPTEDFEYIKTYLSTEEIKNVGIVGINYKNNGTVKGFKLTDNPNKNLVIDVKTIITSGSIINLANYKKIEGFKAELFIDFVDFDLCFQFLEKGFVNKAFINIFLDHHLGKLKTFKFLFFKKTISTHPPIRYYYIYRNFYYLLRNEKKETTKKNLKSLKKFYGIKSMAIRWLVADSKKETFKMIKRGLKDAKVGILGPYVENK